VLPSAPAIGRHLRPAVTTIRRTSDGIELCSRASLPGGGVMAYFLLQPMISLMPAYTADPVRRTQEIEMPQAPAAPPPAPGTQDGAGGGR
jgi:hypothetical protein